MNDDDVYEYRIPGVRAKQWTGHNETEIVEWLAQWFFF